MARLRKNTQKNHRHAPPSGLKKNLAWQWNGKRAYLSKRFDFKALCCFVLNWRIMRSLERLSELYARDRLQRATPLRGSLARRRGLQRASFERLSEPFARDRLQRATPLRGSLALPRGLQRAALERFCEPCARDRSPLTSKKNRSREPPKTTQKPAQIHSKTL